MKTLLYGIGLMFSLNFLYAQTDALYISQSGNVGIGTTNPTNPLSVAGKANFDSIGIGTSTPNFPLSFSNAFGNKISLWYNPITGKQFGIGIQDKSLQMFTGDGGYITFGYGSSSNFNETMRIKSDGNVSIGATFTSQIINMIGGLTINGTGDTQILVAQNNTPGMAINANNSSFTLYDYVNNTWNASLTSSGGNITMPGTLTVNGSQQSYTIGNYLNSGRPSIQNSGWGTQTTTNVSINSAGVNLASCFNVYSDQRIKTNIEKSIPLNDMETLNQIEIVNYVYKDKIQYGNRTQKKVIGQQLERVYPTAVNHSTNIVPDIFRAVESATFNPNDQKLILSLQNHGLKVNEKIKLIMGKEQKIVTVHSVTQNTFTVDHNTQEERVFVYGREVSDFRTVDYDAISMLNVSATQALIQKVKQLEAENMEILKRLAKLEAEKAASKLNLSPSDR